MAKPQSLHYCGGLDYERGGTRLMIGRGYPVCVSGYAARRIADEPHRMTAEEKAVTCAKCQKHLRNAGLLPVEPNLSVGAPWPCTVVFDRYTGGYSGALWLAFPLEASDVPAAIEGGDNECHDFWAEHSGVVGKGSTPDAAVRDLIAKQAEAQHG